MLRKQRRYGGSVSSALKALKHLKLKLSANFYSELCKQFPSFLFSGGSQLVVFL